MICINMKLVNWAEHYFLCPNLIHRPRDYIGARFIWQKEHVLEFCINMTYLLSYSGYIYRLKLLIATCPLIVSEFPFLLFPNSLNMRTIPSFQIRRRNQELLGNTSYQPHHDLISEIPQQLRTICDGLTYSLSVLLPVRDIWCTNPTPIWVLN